MWREKRKGKRKYKGKESNERGDQKTKRKTLLKSRTNFVIKPERKIYELISLDCAEDECVLG